MVLVNVAEETNLVSAVFLADLAGQVVRPSKTRIQLNINITSPSYSNAALSVTILYKQAED